MGEREEGREGEGGERRLSKEGSHSTDSIDATLAKLPRHSLASHALTVAPGSSVRNSSSETAGEGTPSSPHSYRPAEGGGSVPNNTGKLEMSFNINKGDDNHISKDQEVGH